MKKIILTALTAVLGLAGNANAEHIDVITSKELKSYIDMYIVCVDGYEYVIVDGNKKVSIVQSFGFYIDGSTVPKTCKNPSNRNKVEELIEKIHKNKER